MDLRGGRRKASQIQDPCCPICLFKFKDQVIAHLDGCSHRFCLDCILKWAKNTAECPVDRKSFQIINAVHKGKKITTVDLGCAPKKRIAPQRYDFTTFCEVCRSQENEDRLISCSACDLSFHMYCLQTPLSSKPAEWACPDCTVVLSRGKRRHPSVSLASAEQRLHPKDNLIACSSHISDEISGSSSIGNVSTQEETSSTEEETSSTEEETSSTEEETSSEEEEMISLEEEIPSAEENISSVNENLHSDFKTETNISPSTSTSLFPMGNSIILTELKKRLVIKPDGRDLLNRLQPIEEIHRKVAC